MKKILLLLILIQFPFYTANSQCLAGKEYVFTFLEQYNDGFEPIDADLIISISSEEYTRVNISIPTLSIQQEVEVFAGTVYNYKIDYLDYFQGYDQEIVDQHPIYVNSEKDITLYTMNLQNYSSDASIVLPVDKLGTNYTVNLYHDSNQHPEILAELKIIAAYDNTSININPTQNSVGGTLQSGFNKSFTLNKGESISFQFKDDITSTKISSSNPVQVFNAYDCINIPSTEGYCDHIYHVVYPDNYLSDNYFLVPFEGRNSKNDQVQIISISNQVTTLSVNNNQIQLNPGEEYKFLLTEPTLIESSNPISITQYALSSRATPSEIGDPFMVQVLPTEQGSYNMNFSVINSNSINDFYLNIIAPSDDNLILDGNDITDQFVDTEYGYKYAKLRIDAGNHNVISDLGAQVFAYGWGDDDSYGYLAGACLKDLSVEITINDSTDLFEFCYGELLDIEAISNQEVNDWEIKIDGQSYFTNSLQDISLEPGKYLIQIIPNNNEFLKSTIEVTIFDEIISNIPDEIYLCREDLSLGSFEVTGGSGEFEFSWENAELLYNSNSLRPSLKNTLTQAIELTFTAVDSYGCEYSKIVDLIPYEYEQLNIPNEIEVCEGELINIDLSNIGIETIYVNGNVIELEDINSFFDGVDQELDVYFEYNDQNGCDRTHEIKIIPLELPFVDTRDFPIAACLGSTREYSIDANSYSVTWIISNGRIVSSDGIISPQENQAINATNCEIEWNTPGDGQITLIVVDLETGCTSEFNEIIPIRQDILPSIQVNNRVADDSLFICESETLQLDAGSENYDYNWFLNEVTQDSILISDERFLNVDSEGLYIVVAYNEFDCIGFDSVYVSIIDPPTLNAGPDEDVCYGSELYVVAEGASNYMWYDELDLLISENDTLYLENISSDRVIKLVGTNEFGCSSTILKRINVVEPITIEAVQEYELCPNETLELIDFTISGGSSSNYNFNWYTSSSINAINNPASKIPEFEISETDELQLEIIDELGCSTTFSFMVYINEIDVVINKKDLYCENEFARLTVNAESESSKVDSASIILVMDISASMEGNNMALSKSGADSFVNSIDTNKTELAIISFDDLTYLELPFSKNKNLMKSTIRNLNPNGGTNFQNALLSKPYGAIYYMVTEANYENKIIVFLTDGDATLDTQEVIDSCLNNDIIFNSVLVAQTGNSSLESISDQTGGVYREGINNVGDVVNSYKEIFENSFYDNIIYEWSSVDFDIDPIRSEFLDINPTQSGQINITITDTLLNCSIDTVININVANRPVIDFEIVGSFCDDDYLTLKAVVLNGTPEFVYNWDIIGTGDNEIVSDQGSSVEFDQNYNYKFKLLVTDANGCTKFAEYEYDINKEIILIADSVELNPRSLNEEISITSISPDNICNLNNSIIEMSVSAKIFNPTDIVSSGRSLSFEKEIIDDKWYFNFTIDSLAIKDNNIKLVGDALLADRISYPIEFLGIQGNINYEYQLFDGEIKLSDECLDEANRFIENSLFQVNSVYPNPVHDRMTLEVSTDLKADEFEFIIVNSFGNEVGNYSKSFLSSTNNNLIYELDLQNLLSGAYYLKIRSHGETKSTGFIKI